MRKELSEFLRIVDTVTISFDDGQYNAAFWMGNDFVEISAKDLDVVLERSIKYVREKNATV